MSPSALEAARGLAWVEVPCRPSSASQSPGSSRAWGPDSGSRPGRLCSPSTGSRPQEAGLSLAAHHGIRGEGPAAGARRAGSREVRHRGRSAGPGQQG